MRLNTRDIQYLNLFESITKARATDVIEAEGSLNFLVKEGELGLAIGKKGANINKVKESLRRPVQVFEDSDDPHQFVKNLCAPSAPRMKHEGNRIIIELPRRERESMPGRRIRLIKELVKKKLDVASVEFVFN